MLTLVNNEFKAVLKSTTEVAGLVTNISNASSEQAEGISHINIAVSALDTIVQENAATAEESASASEEMSAQSVELKSIVEDIIRLTGVGGHLEGHKDRNDSY